jgi:iron complex transport system permease protein
MPVPAVRRTGAAPPGPSRFRVLMTVLGLAVPLVVVLAVGVGAVWIPPRAVWSVVLAHLSGGARSDVLADQIVWQVRMPRVLTAFVVEAGLAVAGAALQAVVRNPLADPYVLGVSSGASLAAVAVLTIGGLAGSGIGAALGVSGAAFVGALVALVLVLPPMTGSRSSAPTHPAGNSSSPPARN